MSDAGMRALRIAISFASPTDDPGTCGYPYHAQRLGVLTIVYTRATLWVVEFDWDPNKNRINIRDHGVDFADAIRIFDSPTFERLDDREDYGEERWLAIGLVEGIELTIIYTDVVSDRGEVRRIISARRATKNERKAYYEAE